MAATVARDQGKTAFVKQVLFENELANSRAVNEAWAKAGNEGTISDTLVNKMRSELGLSGNLRGNRGKPAARGASANRSTGQRPDRKASSIVSETQPRDRARPPSGRRGNPGIELETEIDRLLFKVMEIGDLADVEEALRKARRLLYAHFGS